MKNGDKEKWQKWQKCKNGKNGDSHNFCLLNSNKVIYWEIIDPKEKGIDETRQIRNQISGLVEKLIAEIK